MLMGWEETMWGEFDNHSETDRIVFAGELIERMQQEIVPKLGQLRRETVLQVLNQDGMDATRLAELIGSRRTTIMRLAEEGRAMRREQNIREAAA
jgi:hypothetical protein